MAYNVRKVLKSLTEQINKSPMLSNTSSAIGSTFDLAQEKISHLQNITSDKYVNITKDFKDSVLQTPTPLPKRLVNYWQWYQQLTGLDKVEITKQHVISIQNKLFECQDHRRDLTREATAVNEKLKLIYSELIQTKRDDPKFVQLTILENKGLQDQTKFTEQLNLLEKEERDYFTQLATAIKEYHDSQAMNAQNYKYLSIVASAVIAIVSLTGSMIYNNRRIVDIRNVITQAQNSMESTVNEKLSLILNRIETQEKNITSAIPKFDPPIEVIFDTSNDQNDQGNNFLFLSANQFTKTAYIAGIAMLTVFIINQISRT